ncbi:TIGR03086 family metal-binding protein [Streptomyces sp. NPDC101227]|uniref:TIGR03086 family metal-binding protein n=1 Tax=Streptomyces sp. NPDC101227 TaxID=3366136 RepID=UPI00382F79BD
MHTTSPPMNSDPRRLPLPVLRELHALALRDSVTAVRRITAADLARPTPCAAWTLGDLLAHMTAQHRGFAAAARGDGADRAHWALPRPGPDPVADHAAAAGEVIAAFAAVGDPGSPFTLADLPAAPTVPARRAIGFHLVDCVVHGWDVSRALDLPYAPGPDVLRAALPVAEAVPDDGRRTAPGSTFRPALPADGDGGPLERILTLLGRSPSWTAAAPC